MAFVFIYYDWYTCDVEGRKSRVRVIRSLVVDFVFHVCVCVYVPFVVFNVCGLNTEFRVKTIHSQDIIVYPHGRRKPYYIFIMNSHSND